MTPFTNKKAIFKSFVAERSYRKHIGKGKTLASLHKSIKK